MTPWRLCERTCAVPVALPDLEGQSPQSCSRLCIRHSNNNGSLGNGIVPLVQVRHIPNVQARCRQPSPLGHSPRRPILVLHRRALLRMDPRQSSRQMGTRSFRTAWFQSSRGQFYTIFVESQLDSKIPTRCAFV